MKKITYLMLFAILLSGSLFAQKNGAYEKANYYLKDKGEVVLRFKAGSKSQIAKINQILSIGHKHIDEHDLEGEAYANTTEQLRQFIALGVPYEVLKEDNELPADFLTSQNRAVNAWDTTWDAYPKYSEYVAKMQYWAATYPSLCTLQTIGTTASGARHLYVLKISDNASVDETEPEFLYTSSMHGDEITGYPMTLHLIDELLTSYGTNSEITDIINNTEIFICPLANPDGSYRTTTNDVFGASGNTPTRANANGTDLNRNYPDAIGGLHPDGASVPYRAETVAFMAFQASRNFVLGANYHGGVEVFNYPLDTSTTPDTANFSIHPHDAYFQIVANEYASHCKNYSLTDSYMDYVTNGQVPGVTNGAAWYSVYGGRQDYCNYFDHNKESTIEISDAKTPPAADLPLFYARNRQAMLDYMKRASYGLHGVVSDGNGNPIHAKVYLSGGSITDNFGSWVETSPTKGDYHKLQVAGSYNVVFEAPGYVTLTIPVTLTNTATTTLNVTMTPTTAIPTAADATICHNQTTNLSATGTGTIRWYDSQAATIPLASTTGYTTPALTANTSYWVEREEALPNVGPATVTGTGVTNSTLTGRYLIFNCTVPTKLKSVAISNSATGDIMVELQNSSGTMLESRVIRLTTTGSKDIELDFFLPVANGLRLVSRYLSNNSNQLTRANSGITYPITSGNISITGNSGTGTFFQFFNWKLAPVKSNRDEVIVTVKPNPTNASISPTTRNAGSGAFTLTVNGSDFENTDVVRWNGANRTTTYVSPTQLTANIPAGDIASAGTANVTVYRACNTSTSSAQTLTINSVCVPTAPVPDVASLPNATGQCGVTVVTVPTATSNCFGTITGTTTSPLTYNLQGTYTITWTYNDGNGNITTQDQTVIVDDTTNPVPNVASLPTITGQCSVTLVPPTANDACAGTITGTKSGSLTISTQGTTIVTWTYNDGNGQSITQNQTVTIDDTTNPVPDAASLPTITGQCSATVTVTPTATDNCAGTIAATTNSPLTYSTQGTYTVVWTYNDGNGQTVTQNQTVIVDDTTNPVPNVASLPTITGQCSVTLVPPTANDACAGTITGTKSGSLTISTQGTTIVTWTYNDGNGQSITQNQTVTIDDTTNPVPDVASLPTITGQCSATVSTTPTATDNCAGTITATTNSPLNYDAQGTYTVVWTYNDGNGQTVTQNQTVIVDDTVAPVANATNLPTITGQCSATVTVTPTATDLCAGTITATTNSPLTYNTQGTYTVVWNYNDGNGNISSQNQTVIVTHGGPIVTYYQDADGDGFGNANVTVTGCTPPGGYVSNNTDCNDNAYSLTNTCAGSVVNIKLFIEGYYTGGSTMTPVIANQGVGNSPVNVEMVTIELRHPGTLALVETASAMLKTDGTMACTYTTAPAGSYYLAIKSGNMIETWSANPVTIGNTPLTYDFSTAANKAYGNNMVQLEPGVFGIFSGDINQDGLIDSSDYSLWENDSNAFAFGVYVTDLNGDGLVDATDYSIWEGNNNNFISLVTP